MQWEVLKLKKEIIRVSNKNTHSRLYLENGKPLKLSEYRNQMLKTLH